MSETTTVKAVGFAFLSPQVVVLFADHHRSHLHVYPPKNQEDYVRLSEDGRANVMVLRSLDKLADLARWAPDLHRVIIFGDANELKDMGVPILDAQPDESGRFVPATKQSVDALLERIEAEAVDLALDKRRITIRGGGRTSVQNAAAPVVATKDVLPFRGYLKALQEAVPEKEGFNFIDDIGVPAVMRLMSDTNQAQFKAACKIMIEKGGAPAEKVKAMFRWVEGFDGGKGPELSKAVEAFLYPEDETDEDVAQVAEQFSVDVKDVTVVAKVYKRIREQSE